MTASFYKYNEAQITKNYYKGSKLAKHIILL